MLLLLLLLLAQNSHPISLSIRQTVVPYHENVKVKVTLEPNELNRLECVVWNTGNSCWSIEGASAPRTEFVEIKRLEAGEYDIVATVVRSDGKTESSIAQHIVVLDGLPTER